MRRREENPRRNRETRVRLFFTLGSLLVAFFVGGPHIWDSTDYSWPIARIVVLIILPLYGTETLHSISWLIVNVRENGKLAEDLRKRLSELLPLVTSPNIIQDDAAVLKSQAGRFR